MDDRHFMNMALDLAAKGEGFTSPNPMVGACLLYTSDAADDYLTV